MRLGERSKHESSVRVIVLELRPQGDTPTGFDAAVQETNNGREERRRNK